MYQQYFLEAFLREEANKLIENIQNDQSWPNTNTSYFFASDFCGASSWIQPNSTDEHVQEKLKNVSNFIHWYERCQLAAATLNKNKPQQIELNGEFTCYNDWSHGWHGGCYLLFKKQHLTPSL